LERRTLCLDDLIAKVVTDARFEAQAEEKQVSYTSEAVTLVGDGVLLRSAVENVIRNAIHHTGAKSEVQVSLVRRQDNCEIQVRDAGPGVDESQLESMFDPFTRTTDARERDSGGFGLGLAIARQAMQIHGGDALARNHPAGGLEVSLWLPLAD
jgi:two-component system sensor histidine kinase CpxA